MDEIEIKITFEDEDSLCGCEITRSGETVVFEKLKGKEQIKIYNALAQFYNLFIPCVKKEEQDD